MGGRRPIGPAARRRIIELALRSKTGASIIGLERAGKTTINPGPEDEIEPGDQILLLGNADQLKAAQVLIGGKVRSEPA